MITNQIQSPSKNKSSNFRAYLFSTLSSVCVVFMQLCLKQLTKHFSPPLVLSVRGSILFISNTLYLMRMSYEINVSNRQTFIALLKRSIASSVTMLLYLGSIKYIPLGVANSLFNTMPIMAFFIEAIYYKKSQIRWLNLVITLVSFIVVLLIIQPPFFFKSSDTTNYFFYFVVLLAALTGSFAMLFLHDLRGKCNEFVVLNHVYFFQTIVSYFWYIITIKDDSSQLQFIYQVTLLEGVKLFVLLILLIILTYLTLYLQIKGLFLCSPALLMPFNYTTVILGFVIDSLIFHTQYNGLMLIGMVMASAGLFTKFLLLSLGIQETSTEKTNNKSKNNQISQ